MMNGLHSISLENHICEGRIYGKQHILSFPIGQAWRENTQLELIHVDLCEPMKTPLINGSRYFSLIVDDHSHMSWVYYLK